MAWGVLPYTLHSRIYTLYIIGTDVDGSVFSFCFAITSFLTPRKSVDKW